MIFQDNRREFLVQVDYTRFACLSTLRTVAALIGVSRSQRALG